MFAYQMFYLKIINEASVEETCSMVYKNTKAKAIKASEWVPSVF